MNAGRPIVFALAFVLAQSTAASAATMVLGGGQARICYDEALSGRASERGLLVCSSALEHDPLTRRDRAATHVNRGVIHLQRRDGKAALVDLDVARRLAPEIGDVFVNRGAALVLMGRYDEADSELTRGISLGSARPQDAHFNRAVAREARGDLKGAYFDYTEAARLAPEWAAPKTELTRFAVSRPGQ